MKSLLGQTRSQIRVTFSEKRPKISFSKLLVVPATLVWLVEQIFTKTHFPTFFFGCRIISNDFNIEPKKNSSTSKQKFKKKKKIVPTNFFSLQLNFFSRCAFGRIPGNRVSQVSVSSDRYFFGRADERKNRLI